MGKIKKDVVKPELVSRDEREIAVRRVIVLSKEEEVKKKHAGLLQKMKEEAPPGCIDYQTVSRLEEANVEESDILLLDEPTLKEVQEARASLDRLYGTEFSCEIWVIVDLQKYPNTEVFEEAGATNIIVH